MSPTDGTMQGPPGKPRVLEVRVRSPAMPSRLSTCDGVAPRGWGATPSFAATGLPAQEEAHDLRVPVGCSVVKRAGAIAVFHVHPHQALLQDRLQEGSCRAEHSGESGQGFLFERVNCRDRLEGPVNQHAASPSWKVSLRS